MSECNYCTLEGIKRRNVGKKVRLRKHVVRGEKEVEFNPPGWDVYVDGERTGTWFWSITEGCVC